MQHYKDVVAHPLTIDTQGQRSWTVHAWIVRVVDGEQPLDGDMVVDITGHGGRERECEEEPFSELQGLGSV